jgi:prepilin-type N-terminal cleavage/methylation domain-containing protein
MLFAKKDRGFGFTLIELLITIAVISILAAIGLTVYPSAQAKARDAKRKADLNDIRNALQLYYNENNSYPCPGFENFVGFVFHPVNNCPLTPTYIKEIPHDAMVQTPDTCEPNFSDYFISISADGQGYELHAKLEKNPPLTPYQITVTPPGYSCTYNYKVTNP